LLPTATCTPTARESEERANMRLERTGLTYAAIHDDLPMTMLGVAMCLACAAPPLSRVPLASATQRYGILIKAVNAII